MSSDKKKNTLWFVKHHPKQFDLLHSNSHLVEYLHGLVQSKKIPNILLTGQHGTGKNALVNTLVYEYFNHNRQDIKNGVIFINGALNRGKDIVTNSNDKGGIKLGEHLNVSNFTEVVLNLKVPYRIVIIDHFDEMTKEAQNALRRIMETKHTSTRFIFICPSLDNVIEAIQSRSVLLVTHKLNNPDMQTLLLDILKRENMEKFISDQLLNTIISLTDGDIRQSINYLQMISYYISETNITSQDEIFHSIFGLPHLKVLDKILEALKDGNGRLACSRLTDLSQCGYYHNEILQLLLTFVVEKPVDILHTSVSQNIIKCLVKHMIFSGENVSESETPLYLFVFDVLRELNLV